MYGEVGRKYTRNNCVPYKIELLNLCTIYLFCTVQRNYMKMWRKYTKSQLIFVKQCLLNSIHHTMTFSYQNTRNTRLNNRMTLTAPEVRTTRYGIDSFRYRSVKLFNEIPTELKLIPNIEKFKKMVTKWIRQRKANTSTQL